MANYTLQIRLTNTGETLTWNRPMTRNKALKEAYNAIKNYYSDGDYDYEIIIKTVDPE